MNDREPELEGPQEALGRRTATSVLWLTGQKWAIRLTGFATIAILTRFLRPEDFGTVAAASTVLPFFVLLADLGFAAYLVQVDKASERMLSTSFWYSLIAGLVLCGALVVVAPLLGAAFKDDQVVPVLRVMSFSVVIIAAQSVPIALLRRAMRFKAIAAQGAVSALVAQCVAVALTFAGFGVWALVWQSLVSPLVGGTFAWIAAKWRPRLIFSREDFVTMTRFGGQVLGVEFVAMIRAWAEAAIISSALGMAGLGYLNIAQRLVQVVQDLTGSALVPVSSVAFAKIRESRERLRRAYLRALRMTYAVLSPPLTLVAVAAPAIVPVLFGDGWLNSIPLAQVLALAGILVVAATLDHGLFYGLGMPGRWFAYALIIDVLTVAGTAVLARFGLLAIAWGFLAVAALATASRWFLVARILGTTPIAAAGPFGFLSIAVVASGAAGWLAGWAAAGLPSIVQIVLIGLAILAVHLVVVRLMAASVFSEVAGYLARFGRASRVHLVRPKEEL